MTWENMVFNFPPNIAIWSIEQSPFDGSIYIGTSHGTYRLKVEREFSNSLKAPTKLKVVRR